MKIQTKTKMPIKKIKIFFVFLIIILIGFYAYHQSRNIFTGPVITITSPENFGTVYGGEFMLKGSVKQVNFLSLNNRQIYTDTNGHFEEKLIAPLGYNIMEIKGKDGFGNEKIVTLEYFVKTKTLKN